MESYGKLMTVNKLHCILNGQSYITSAKNISQYLLFLGVSRPTNHLQNLDKSKMASMSDSDLKLATQPTSSYNLQNSAFGNGSLRA